MRLRTIGGAMETSVPSVLYHGTSMKVWRKIQQQRGGLRPHAPPLRPAATWTVSEPVGAIWFADKKAEDDRSKPVILVIETDPEQEWQDELGDGRVWMTSKIIPTERVKVAYSGVGYDQFKQEAYKDIPSNGHDKLEQLAKLIQRANALHTLHIVDPTTATPESQEELMQLLDEALTLAGRLAPAVGGNNEGPAKEVELGKLLQQKIFIEQMALKEKELTADIAKVLETFGSLIQVKALIVGLSTNEARELAGTSSGKLGNTIIETRREIEQEIETALEAGKERR